LWLPDIHSGGYLFCLSVPICIGFSYFFKVLKTVSFGYLSGLLLVLVAANNQQQQQITSVEQRTVDAVIIDLPTVNEYKTSFTIKTPEQQTFLISHYRGFHPTSVRQQVPNYQPGEYYRFDLRLKPPHGTANGVGFDRERWLFRHGIDGIGSIQQAQRLNPVKLPLNQAIKVHINQWRGAISSTLDYYFTNDRDTALLHALSIGDKSRFEPRDHHLFQVSGTAHLIAISGLHIGMVAAMGGVIGWFLYFLFPQQRLPRPLLQVIIGLSLAIVYASLAGFSVSTQRALIMLAVYGWFKWRRRSVYAWDVWSISLLTVLVTDPLNVLDAGFWLSFWAVAILIFAFQGRSSHHGKLYDFVKIQWLLLIGMLPLSLLQFGSLKIWAPLVNLFVIPIMTFLFIPVLFCLIIFAGVSGEIPDILVNYIHVISQLFWHFLGYFSDIDLNLLSWPIQGVWSFILISLAAIILLLPATIPQRYWGVFLIIIALWPKTSNIPSGEFKADILDVGQGTAVLIRTQNHQLLYDVGARYPSGFNMADAVILPWLQQHNINSLDAVILSHKDNDHAGAYPALSESIEIQQTLSTDGRFTDCVVGQHWQWDGVDFNVISPYNIQPYLKNNSSCVLKISTSNASLLLTGDIEQAVEYRLRQQHPKTIESTILLIPHHGSNTSSTKEFVQAVNPEIAINSSGAYNQFSHPTNQVRAVYQALDIPIIDTQNSGRISLMTISDRQPKFYLVEFRQNQPRIWRKKAAKKELMLTQTKHLQ